MTTTALALVAIGALLALVVVVLVGARWRRRARVRVHLAAARLEPGPLPERLGLDATLDQLEQSVEDALARRRIEHEQEARMAEALTAIGDGIVLVDRGGVSVFENEQARTYLGGRHGEAIVESAIERLALAALAGVEGSEVVDLFGPPRRILVLTARPLEGAGALVVIEDETERRRIDAVRKDFVANISHELKTPVGGLGVLADTLRTELESGDADPDVVSRLVGRMHDESMRASRTIDDLLQLTKIEASGPQLFERVSMAEIIGEAMGRAGNVAEQAEVALDAQIAADIEIAGDRRQLVSAIYNLVENAVKYSDAGGTVTVALDRHDLAACVRVADEGIGIPRRDLDRIFERFYRVDQARSRGTGGTGLGLSIVRHVAVNHGGSVQVDSHEGEGSTFEFHLPLSPEPVLPAFPPADAAEPAHPHPAAATHVDTAGVPDVAADPVGRTAR